ncbi:P1 family peptidase [Saccharopolyspora gloriosae]|uniref:L-aminopeptidase/D-esterase-like protein n=1 Tax=Saccharopolyspora gloriosae TaxID=455344 RepID=A0A840NBL8_9PSEU|nr:P1 family peptidase [Saccharopolyspora gloriosae]MBB5067608.1 L-aminopeptidase/D-esterase-like protein [Saccharopolyspora gloriosae]
MGFGVRDSIVDVAGVLVGHHQRLDEQWATGTSVVLVPRGAVAAVDVRGGGPGTRETDVLEPTHLVSQAHGVVLTGGSAYGLAAADGAMRWLAERGHGLQVGAQAHEVVPVVPAAVLFDLPMSDWGNRPDAEFGRLACEAATAHETREGNVGAGTGAVAGAVKGGIGTASAVFRSAALGVDVTVGALFAVNSLGSVIDPETGLPWEPEPGLRAPADAEIAAARGRHDPAAGRPGRHGTASRPLNTTIGTVAVDLALTKAHCRRIAVAAHDGLARAIRPAHTMLDGDTAFVLATGDREPGAQWVPVLDEVCAVAARVVRRAVVRAVLAAEPVGEVTSYTRLYPSARE